MTSSKPIQFVAKKVLHIDSEERYRRQPKNLEERAKDAIDHTYLEEEPSVGELTHLLVPTKKGVVRYVRSLFPCAGWIPRYNFHWLFGDALAGECSFLISPLSARRPRAQNQS